MATRSTETDLAETKRLKDLGGHVEALARQDSGETKVFALPVHDTALFVPHRIPDQFPGHFTIMDHDSPAKGDGGFHQVPDPVFGVGDGVFPIYGTDNADMIDGGQYGDIIYAYAGNDSVNGGDGHDNIDLGTGDDYALGEGGNDFIQGGSGNDAILGDFVDADGTPLDGNDFLDGGSGNDILYGAGGDDNLFGGTGTDFMDGEDGNDILIGTSGGTDDMYGGAGADSFVSFDNSQQHNVWDYSATEGDMVEGDSWTYNAGTNVTAVHLDNGSTPFLLHDYNAGISGINLISWNPEPAA